MQKALITGASSGIGYELAKIMASKGHDLVLVSRDLQKLNAVKKELQGIYDVKIRVENCDLSKVGAARKLYLATKGEGIEILVNNAGVGLKGTFFGDDLSTNQDMAYLNMNSLMDMTYYFGGDMIKKNKGKIVNIASIVAFFPGPKQPVYYATKSFVRSFSRALAYNLRGSGVSVTAIHPGVTKTNFFKTAEAPDQKSGASAASVAHLAYSAMMKGKIEVTHGLWNKFLTNVFVRFTPYKYQPYIVDRASEV